MTSRSLSELEARIGHRFTQRELFQEAFCHSSYANEQTSGQLQNNERLEFLGDAVLNLSVSHLLMTHFPTHPEGDLSRMRANLVNEPQLAELAQDLGIGPLILLGKGEHQSRGWEKPSILADTFEALIAAIYLDGGFETAFRFIRSQYDHRISEMDVDHFDGDYKSKLQELVQGRFKTTPAYETVDTQGPDHDKTFVVRIEVAGYHGKGIGKSKKAAEQDAARKALRHLKTTRE